MKKQQTTSTATATPAPKGKGSLIGRGALIRQLVAEQTPLALFISTVRAKYPVCGTAWCEKHYKRANARLAARAAKTTKPAAAAPAAPVETPAKSTTKGKGKGKKS